MCPLFNLYIISPTYLHISKILANFVAESLNGPYY